MKKILITLTLFLSFGATTALASFDTNLKYGSKGEQVKELQEFLIDGGYLQGTATGNFYSLTFKAVKSWQLANSLPNTGYFGIMSRTVANNAILAQIGDTNQSLLLENGTTTMDTPLTASNNQPVITGTTGTFVPTESESRPITIVIKKNGLFLSFEYTDVNGITKPMEGDVNIKVMVEGNPVFRTRLQNYNKTSFEIPADLGDGKKTLEVYSYFLDKKQSIDI